MNNRPNIDRPPYTGDGLESIANLTPDTNTPTVLRNVARWHEGDYRADKKRHAVIAGHLYAAANLGEQAAMRRAA